MKAVAAFLICVFIHFTVGIPIEETEEYKKSKIEYDALIAKLNATDPCQLSFKCTDREECVNFLKCKTGETCPRTKCVPRKLCESTICPPGTECAEFESQFNDLDEYKYDFTPRINYVGNTRGIRPGCVTRKVPSDGDICGENEMLNNIKKSGPLGMSEFTCTIPGRFGLVQPLGGPYLTYCVCKKDYVRDDTSGECISRSKCPDVKPTQQPINFATKKKDTETPIAYPDRIKFDPKKIVKNFPIKNFGHKYDENGLPQKPLALIFPKLQSEKSKTEQAAKAPINELRRKDPHCPEGLICSINKDEAAGLVEPPHPRPSIAGIKRKEKSKTSKRLNLLQAKFKFFTRRPLNNATKTLDAPYTKML